MEKEKQNIQVGMISDYFKSQIKIPDIQREDTAWSLEQKQMLIDSLYNNYDIPKVYLRKDDENPEVWWLLDGQQRLTAITEFMSNRYPLDGGSDVTSLPKEIHNKYYKELPPKEKAKITTRTLDFVILVCNEHEEEDLFLRLNKGTPLNAAEKRNAIRGEFRDAAKELSRHKFFHSKVNFSVSRYAGDAVAAQLSLLAIRSEPADTKGKQLWDLYQSKKRYPEKDKINKIVNSTLTLMNRIFTRKEPYMKKYSVATIFLFLKELKDNYSISHISNSQLYNFFNEFEKSRQTNNQLSEDDTTFDRDLNRYTFACVNSPDSREGIKDRHEVLFKKFLLNYQDIELKDSKRNFTIEQKEAIYSLCAQMCQGVVGFTCPRKGEILPFEECEFDHIKEHADAGHSTVKNGQILCRDCHSHKTVQSDRKRSR
jgi:hypothetical protein